MAKTNKRWALRNKKTGKIAAVNLFGTREDARWAKAGRKAGTYEIFDTLNSVIVR